jgi:hypothetical protein
MPSNRTSSADELATQLDAILSSVPSRTHWGVGSSSVGYDTTLYLPGDWHHPRLVNCITEDDRAFSYFVTERHLTLGEALADAIDTLTDVMADVYNDEQVAA